MATAKHITKSHLDVQIQDEIRRAVEGGLANISMQKMLGSMLTMVAEAERSTYLRSHPQDKGNGSYHRKLLVGSLPLSIGVPRTRGGDFRPQILPPLYSRGYSEETQSLLLGMLCAGKSINAVKIALRKMGLSVSTQDLEAISEEFVETFELHNSKPVDTDMIALFLDGKLVDIKDGDRVRSACIYLVIGLNMSGRKSVLACHIGYGKETLEEWKKVLRKLLDRGLRQVSIIVQDDFSGLLPITKNLFPKADVQLCTVHLQRNVRRHMSKADGVEFNQHIKAIKASVDIDSATKLFIDLLDKYEPMYLSFIKEVRKKQQHYLAFLKYPRSIQPTFSTTNPVETVNNQLERLRCNAGGLFQSEHNAKLKLGVVIQQLEEGCWKSPSGSVQSVLTDLHLLFANAYEQEDV
jgi:putative transposase